MPQPPRPLSARRRAALAALLVLVAPLTACTGESDPDPVATGATPSVSADGGGGDEATATVAEAQATLPNGIGTVDVAVRSLTLDGNGSTMTLRVAFTPHLADPEEAGDVTLSELNNFFFLHPVLLDRQHLKRYSVIEGEGVQDWLTNDDAVTRDGEPLESWFVYAAPEDDVDEITFTIDEWSVELPAIPVAS